MSNNDILQLSIYTVSGLAIGIFLHKIIMPLIARLAAKTHIKSDDLIVKTIRKWVIPWFLTLGLYLGLRQLDLESRFYYWIENGLMIFYIFSGTMIVAQVVSGLIKIKGTGTDAVVHSSSIISNIVIIIVYCLGLLIILQSQGISITPVLTALGVGGLAVALALQPTLSNLFAGLQIITSGKFNPGDYVKLSSGENGYVEDITWRSTTIKGDAGHTVIVPNSKLADMVVTNYFLPDKELSFSVELAVSPNNNLEAVEKITKEVIKETLMQTEGGVKEFEPVIRYFAVGDNKINMRAVLRTTEYSYQFVIRHEFIKKIHARFKLEGIKLALPLQLSYNVNEKEA
jgi:small-conductance mechanosensitive channel